MRSTRRWAGACSVAVVLACWLATPVAAQQQPRPPEPGAPGAAPDPRPGVAFADPQVARLQLTATEVQRELAGLAGQIHGAETDLRTATGAAASARRERERADAAVAAQQDQVDAYAAGVFTAMGQPSAVRALLGASNPDDFLRGADLLAVLRRGAEVQLVGALDRQRAAQAAQQRADGAASAATQRKADLDRRTADASNRAAAVSSELHGQLADADAAVAALQRAQAKRNADTAANWRGYLAQLADAGITPPPAAALRDRDRLPPGLTPLGAAAGVAQSNTGGRTLLVLPKETVAAVTAAMAALGKPYVPGAGAGPESYSCDGLVRTVFGAGGLPVPGTAAAQLAQLAPVAPTEVQPGDLVFLGPARLGVQGVGIVLDPRTMLAADGRLAEVVVTDLPGSDTVLGFARPALPHRASVAVPKATDRGLTWRCGGVQLPPSPDGATSGAWGGYPNGLIPPAALCPIGVGGHVLRCDAAQAFRAMSQAYAGAFGRPVCVTDSYRTFNQQVALYAQKPALAAVPGTSNHGWGLALDLCGGAESWSTPEHAWLSTNAVQYGWHNPTWARQGAGREEPWHWEFTQ